MQAKYYFIRKAKKNIINGLLLGDGCVHQVCKTPRLRVTTIHKEFIDYIISKFHNFNMKYYLTPGGEGYFQERKIYRQDSYRVQSLTDQCFIEFRQKWYKDGTKVIPKDLLLNPEIARYWFYGDGYSDYDSGRKYVRVWFATNCFTSEECDFLIKQFLKHNILFNKYTKENGQNIIGCTRQKDIIKFFDYIGASDVRCFEYKWKKKS